MAGSLVKAAFALLLDVAVLVIGLVGWWALKRRGRYDDKPRPLESITEKAYILFLRTCRDMCLTLTVVSAAMLVPYFNIKVEQLDLPITADSEHSSNICTELGTNATDRFHHHDGGAGCNLLCEEMDLPMGDIFQCAMLCIMTVVNGGVALAFLQRFQRQVQMFDDIDTDATSPGNGHRSQDDMDRIGRTLWFTELPTADRQTGQAWMLDEEGFQRVEADITRELETHLNGQPAPKPELSPIEEIRVAPEVSRMLEVAPELRNAMERGNRYAELAEEELAKQRESAIRREDPLTTQWRSCLSKRWYERRSSIYRDRSRALHDELQELVEAKKQMCGSAFVTFKSVSSARVFYSRKPDCCGRRRDLFFSFGHPPFASVTLRCMRAPHPSDLIWQNLQVPRRSQRCNLITRFILLLLVMMALVACLLVAVEHEWWSDLPIVKESSSQIASLVLLVINSLLLPELIYRLACAVKEHRHSRAEILQLHLNFIFLGINTLLIPLTGSGIIEILNDSGFINHPFRTTWNQVSSKSLGWVSDQIVQGCAFHTFRNTKWSFFLRYIMNSACFSNTMSGLALHQIVYREVAQTLALTQRDEEDASTPWPFPWGYWYAWSLNILATGLLLSMAVPLSLPCTALFFAIRHAVDQHNLCHNVYVSGFESEGTFVPRVLHYVRLIVATWWFFMGCVTLSGAKRAIKAIANMADEAAVARGGREALQVVPDIVTYFAIMMILLSLMMFIHSFWTLLESTHLLAWEGIKAVLEKEQAHIFDRLSSQDNGRSIHRADITEPGPLGRFGAAIGWLLCDADIFRQSSELIPTDENGCRRARLEWDARAAVEGLPAQLLPLRATEQSFTYL